MVKRQPACWVAARALILGLPSAGHANLPPSHREDVEMPSSVAGRAEKLESYLDLPWCRAGLFYIQKLVYCVEARGKITWQDLRQF